MPPLVATVAFFRPWHRVYHGGSGVFGGARSFESASSIRERNEISYTSGYALKPEAAVLLVLLVVFSALSAARRTLWFAAGEVVFASGALGFAAFAVVFGDCGIMDALPAQSITLASLGVALLIPVGRILYGFVLMIGRSLRP